MSDEKAEEAEEAAKPTRPTTVQEAADLARAAVVSMRERMATKCRPPHLSLVPAEHRESERRRLAEERVRQRYWSLKGCGVPDVEAQKLSRHPPAKLRPMMSGETGGEPGVQPGCVRTAAGIVDRFLSGDRRILLLLGTRSRGKTAAASYFIDCAMRRMRINVAAELPANRPHFAKAAQIPGDAMWSAKGLEKRLKFHRYLVIDDLGRESREQSSRMTAILDAIYDAGTWAVITTQLTQKPRDRKKSVGESFDQRYGADVWDRIIERGRWAVVTGPNMRELLGDEYKQEQERVGGDQAAWTKWVRKFRRTAGRDA